MTTIFTLMDRIELWRLQVVVIAACLIVMFGGMIWEAYKEEKNGQ